MQTRLKFFIPVIFIFLFSIHEAIAQNYVLSSYGKRQLNQNRNQLKRQYSSVKSVEIENANNLFNYSRSFSSFKNSNSDSINLVWKNEYASMKESGYSCSYALASDRDGFIYSTGLTTNLPNGTDFLTIKYDSNGQQIWSATYNGAGNHDDVAQFIAVDTSGNVYVAGSSRRINTGNDIAIVKYSSSGEELWSKIFSGAGQVNDEIAAMVVDQAGNVYINGTSNETGENDDIIVLKYDTNGNREWIHLYNGTDNVNDRGVDMVVDDDGNVYVIGDCRTPEYSRAYILNTFKLNKHGDELWRTTVEGTGRSYARDIATDSCGNVIVLGSIDIQDKMSDFVTAKFNPFGEELWRAYFGSEKQDVPFTMIVDRNCNIYIAGSEDYCEPDCSDYIALKYNANGELIWTDRFDETETGNIIPHSIFWDRRSTIYITTHRYNQYYRTDNVIVKIDTAGERLWVKKHETPEWIRGTCLDISTNLYISGSVDTDAGDIFVTNKFDTLGNNVWQASYSGSASTYDESNFIVRDQHGNIYIAGKSSYDFLVIKYDSSGVEQWVQSFSPPVWGIFNISKMELDSEGNVYLAGDNNDFITIKMDPSGQQKWIKFYSVSETSWEEFPDLEIDGNDNAIIAGSADYYPIEKTKIITIKYDPDGNQNWMSSWIGQGYDYAYMSDMTIDQSGNIYILGEITSVENPFNSDYFLIKYSSSGKLLWEKIQNEYNDENPQGVLTDRIGNVIINNYHLIIKYDAYGNEIWRDSYMGGGPGFASKRENLLVDDFNSIYVFLGHGKVVKYHPNGNLVWASSDEIWGTRYGGYAIDNASNVFVFYKNTNQQNHQNLLAKLNSNGDFQWFSFYDYEINDLLLADKGNLFLTGNNVGLTWCTCVTMKLKPTNIPSQTVPVDFKLSQNYPNPFYYGTCIRFELPASGHVSLKVYNLLGQEVATLIDEPREKGIHVATWLKGSQPSSVYFYRLEVNGFSKSKKFLLVK